MQPQQELAKQSSNQTIYSDLTPGAAPRGHTLRKRWLGGGSLVLLAVAASACSGADVAGEVAEGEEAGAIDSTRAALNSSALCDLVTNLSKPIEALGSAVSVSADCGTDEAKSTGYLGSATGAAWNTSNARTEAKALYCALQATDGRNAVAQFDTPLGKFGIQSRIAIIDKDPVNLHVMGQRIGSLVAFGQEFPTELQFFDFASPTEYQNAQSVIYKRRDAYPLPPKTYWQSIPAHRGQYSLFTTGGHHFDIHADAEIPVGGIFNVDLSLDFVNRMPYDGRNAFAYAMTRPATASGIEEQSEDARRVSFATMQAECKACRQSIPPGGIDTCGTVCPDNKIMEDHFRTCGTSQGFGACTDAYYSDLGDRRLPYEGNYGASGPFVDMGSPNNWWHIGAPKDSQLVATLPGEPVYSLLSGRPELSDPTTRLGFGLGVNASVKIFKIALGLNANFDFRDGLAIRESQTIDPDSSPAVMNHVTTWVDSEARAKIDATLKVTADLSFFGEVTLVDAAYNIFDKSVRSSSNAARYLSSASWSDGQPSSITSYKVGGVETDLASCLDAPPVILPEVEVQDPKEVAGTIIDQTYDRVVPCNIRLCDPNTGTRNDCDWDTSTNSMSCTDSGQACNCDETNVDMCALDGAGQITAVYPGTPVGQNYCDRKTACGNKEICDNSTQCGSGGFCDQGCCTIIK